MIIIGIDPGDTTGFAVVKTTKKWPEEFPDILERGVISKWRGLVGLIEKYKPDVIVAEEYRLYAGKARQQINSSMIAARVLGAVEYIAEARRIPLVVQSAAIGKWARLPDNIFKMLGSTHERDALCHVIAYLKALGGEAISND